MLAVIVFALIVSIMTAATLDRILSGAVPWIGHPLMGRSERED